MGGVDALGQNAEPHVYVISDRAGTRVDLSERVRSAGWRVWTFHSARDFLDLAGRITPGCIVADLSMPELDGLALLSELKRRGLDLPVILVIEPADTAMTVAAARAGAIDFVQRPFIDEVLRASIHNALDELERTRQSQDIARDASRRVAQLTHREREVLQRLVAGKTNKDIAYELTISVRTVEFYRGRTMRKMNASRFSELVRLALAAGVGFDIR